MRILLLLFFSTFLAFSQDAITITGLVQKEETKNPLENAIIILEGTSQTYASNDVGEFKLATVLKGNYILKISAPNYTTKRLPLSIEDSNLDLGIIFLKKDITIEQTDNLIALTDSDLSDDSRTVENSTGQVLLNGIPMNKFFNGRPKWNNWGGLNDVIRNQEFSNDLNTHQYRYHLHRCVRGSLYTFLFNLDIRFELISRVFLVNLL